VFQRIPPKINKKNIRYKIRYPDEDENMVTAISQEWEFDKKAFYYFQNELSFIYDGTNKVYSEVNILDTISFMFEELKNRYDRNYAIEQAKKDSVFRNSIVQSIMKNGYTWTENIPQEIKKDTLFFMPKWKFPLVSSDTLYSDSINARFLLIDMWDISCHPCNW
jgi:hypothetical protein